MAHVLILREAPSFVEGKELINGTHEIMESNIAKRRYEFNAARQGYTIPTSSEWKLIWYRMKKDAIPEFLKDLKAHILNPKKLPKGFLLELLGFRKRKIGVATYGFSRMHLLAMLILRFIPLLNGIDKAEGKPNHFNKTKDSNFWGYNICLGIIEDKEGSYGEEL